MTVAALIFMLVSVTGVIALAGWCYYRVLTTPPPDRPDGDEDPPGP